MKTAIVGYADGFNVLAGNGRSQAATMVLAPKTKEGGHDNKHRGSDQWLYVAEGRGEAVVDGKTLELEPGSLVLILHGETYEIRNTSDIPMKTLNFYVPAAYTEDGDELPAGKSE